MPPTSGNRFATCIELTQLRNSALEALGFATTNALALITRLFSCWIASFSVDAMAIDDDDERLVRSLGIVAGHDRGTEHGSHGAGGHQQCRRSQPELVVDGSSVRPFSIPAPNGSDGKGNAMTFTGHEPRTTPAAVPRNKQPSETDVRGAHSNDTRLSLNVWPPTRACQSHEKNDERMLVSASPAVDDHRKGIGDRLLIGHRRATHVVDHVPFEGDSSPMSRM